MAKQYKNRLNTPQQFLCPNCKKIFEITEVVIKEATSDQNGYIRAKTTVHCTHCNEKFEGIGTFKKVSSPESMN